MILRPLSGLCVVAGIVLAPVFAVAYSSGAPAGFAGNVTRSDGSPQTCAVPGCHASFELNSGTGGVAVTAPATVGVGETVRITVTVDNQTDQVGSSPRQGFEATVRDASGAPWGTITLADALTTKFASGTSDYVTHTSIGVTETAWQFDWTPDAVPAGGAVTLYVVGNAANGNGGTSGDHVYTETVEIAVATTATDESPREAGFRIGLPRPHPAVAGVAVSFDISMERSDVLSARVVDGLGRVVLDIARGERALGTVTLRVPTDRLAPGTYFLVVDSASGRQAQPFTVSR